MGFVCVSLLATCVLLVGFVCVSLLATCQSSLVGGVCVCVPAGDLLVESCVQCLCVYSL